LLVTERIGARTTIAVLRNADRLELPIVPEESGHRTPEKGHQMADTNPAARVRFLPGLRRQTSRCTVRRIRPSRCVTIAASP